MTFNFTFQAFKTEEEQEFCKEG